MSFRIHVAQPLALLACATAAAVMGVAPAQADSVTVLEVRYTPVPRAQVAIWLEAADGRFLATVALTEAVAYRGIGNRPGASQLNSGFRWPYGRREGALPIWARRRASAPGARLFPRVIYQSRAEGHVVQEKNDQSVDDYYCLEFDPNKSARDALDAVSCASVFMSDKGRYLTDADLAAGYAEPFELPHRQPSAAAEGFFRPLSRESLYPARMDAVYCPDDGCFDHEDFKRFASDVRAVMPEIDVVTRATAPGGARTAVLHRIPVEWPPGDYVVWVEVNVEGDYLEGEGDWSPATYPRPTMPDVWDDWGYGYPYRGQPSIAYRVPIAIGKAGEHTFETAAAAGRSSWDFAAPDYGVLEAIDGLAQTGGSGVDRLQLDEEGRRVVVLTRSIEDDAASAPAPMGGTTSLPDETSGDGLVLEHTGGGVKGPVGPVADLSLRAHEDPLRAHTWLHLKFRAARSERPLHGYEVRVSHQPISDESSFLAHGRPAKGASESREGSTALMLPNTVAPGELVETTIGDLVADTQYYVAVRAIDDVDRRGPISVASLRTAQRRFAQVSACFVATAAYGDPLAREIHALRRFRDRHLAANPLGRGFVRAYAELGPFAARLIAPYPELRRTVRALLEPVIAIARALP